MAPATLLAQQIRVAEEEGQHPVVALVPRAAVVSSLWSGLSKLERDKYKII